MVDEREGGKVVPEDGAATAQWEGGMVEATGGAAASQLEGGTDEGLEGEGGTVVAKDAWCCHN